MRSTPSPTTNLLTAAQLLLRRSKAPLRTRLGELKRGSLIELTGARSSGRLAVGLAVLAAATAAGEAAAFVDAGDCFDPRAARDAGVRLERLLWVRPRRLKEALGASELLLGAGFPLVVLDLPDAAGAPPAAWLRLSRLAEKTSAVLLAVTTAPVTGAKSLVRAEPGRGRWTDTTLDGIAVRLQHDRLPHLRLQSS